MGPLTDYLASWNDRPATSGLLDFVQMATAKGPRFVGVANRIATFDNERTMWSEQPGAPQAAA